VDCQRKFYDALLGISFSSQDEVVMGSRDGKTVQKNRSNKDIIEKLSTRLLRFWTDTHAPAEVTRR
jgi:hypothetical protein